MKKLIISRPLHKSEIFVKKRACVLVLLGILFFVLINAAFADVYKPQKTTAPYPHSPVLYGYQSTAPSYEEILIILDCSFSMADRLGAETKIQAAKRALNNVLNQIPSNIRLGLRIYGHKLTFLGIGSCTASELAVPIGPNNTQQIRNVVNALKPVGSTPIIYSIKQAVLYDFSPNAKKRIILISDGEETCDGDPCKYALTLVREYKDVKIDVIGFNLNNKNAINQLQCVALTTKANFYNANTAAELYNSLGKTLNVQKEVQGQIMF
ncbi:MAG: VWA domain-containing protein [Candidatus Gastranaerophilales bacterium]|nr:VWA domain-containing protein [Candidatus Gastranaerophilales bacterium]